MAIVNKWAALLKLKNVLVYCCNCGNEMELPSPSVAVRDALHDASYIQGFEKEIALLQRTQALFSRFPDSRHPIKINHECSRGERLQVQEDVEFDKVLAEDSELRHFLETGSFLLPARLNAISKAYVEWQGHLDDSGIRCGVCQRGHYVIETALFERL